MEKERKNKEGSLKGELFLKGNEEQKEARKSKSKCKRSVRERGITLIALVITIIILLS